MRTTRIYHPGTLQQGATITLRLAAQRHLGTVLRLRPGAPLILFDGEGSVHLGVLENNGKAAVREAIDDHSESPLAIHLLQGVSRGERMDYAIQKAVELGVTEITPLLTERCVVRLKGERAERRLQHWREIIINACEQCGRSRLPRLNPLTTLEQAAATPSSDLNLLLDPAGGKGPTELPRPAGKISLLIGPEGGLSDREIGQTQRAGFTPLRLGPRILRTETAALAAISALQVIWGDLGR